jgi:hypothetical protein
MNLLKHGVYVYMSLFSFLIHGEVNFFVHFGDSIICPLEDNKIFRLNANYGKASAKNNIYDYTFYLQDKVRINTTFTMGSTYSVIYLNYPSTFTNVNMSSNPMKDVNGAGIIILSPQSSNLTAENLSSQQNIKPFAYFTLNEIPIGWQLYCPSDYYEGIVPNSKNVITINTYNQNLFFGKNVGPSHTKADFNRDFLSSYLKLLGKGNICFGNNTGDFTDDHLISYNNIFGYDCGGKLVTGSFNQAFGSYNLVGKEINPNILSQDYYASNENANYNNVIGFGNMNVSHPITVSHFGKKIANKQNNIVGNFNFHSIWFGMRNCVIGNRNFIANNNNVQFSYVDSNIVIGNDIAWLQDNTTVLANVWKNIWLIPSGTYDSGGINMQPALSNDMIESIMIGSCGGNGTYDRSYKTFIANIFDTSLIDSEVDDSKKQALNLGVGEEPLPQTVFVSQNDQLGSPAIKPYGIDHTTALAQPGNVYNVDDVIFDELLQLPIIGIAFENTVEARENGLFYAIDVNQIIDNPQTPIHKLSSFLTYHTKKNFLSKNGNVVHKEKKKKENYLTPSVAGFEYYYVIPLLIRALQICFSQITELKNTNNQMKNMLQQIAENNILLTQYVLESTQNNLELKDSLEKNLVSLKVINEKLIQ